MGKNLCPRALRRRCLAFVVVPLVLALASACVPNPPPYPYYGPYGSRQGVINKANDISVKLENHIKGWLDGRNAATIPADLLPDGREPLITGYRLVKPAEVQGSQQWIIRPGKNTIDWNASAGGYQDPKTTYLLMPHMFVPFGSKVLVDGQFPHARYFTIQPSPPMQPEQPRYQAYGVPETSIVDADINPNPGSTNPFRVGANRNATNRSYRVTVNMTNQNGPSVDPSYKPGYRGPGNTRAGSGIEYRGPWGDPNYPENNSFIDKRGLWNAGELWIRYYAPDKNVDALGGVPYPKVTYELPDGRQYYIVADLAAFNASGGINKTVPIKATAAQEPTGLDSAPNGWFKQWGIIRQSGVLLFGAGQKTEADAKQYARDVDRGVNGRGENLPAPQNYEHSATLCNHCDYIQRGMSLGTGKVLVLTGRLPTTPKTRNAEATMTGAQMRYLSITTYDDTYVQGDPLGMPITNLMDDEIITDANGYYSIVYSRPEDRPANATAANGVTWVNWGPKGHASFIQRWLSVGPEWSFSKAPNETNLGRGSDWASASYNPALIGTNNRTGFMGEYLSNVHYLNKADFQNLASNVRWNQIPAWK